MSIRAFLASRFRKLMLFGVLAWLCCAASGLSASSGLIPSWVAPIPFIGFAAVVLLMLLWIRCPRCGGRLGQIVGYVNAKERFYQRRINFCPYCGVNFDEPCSPSPNNRLERSRGASSLDEGEDR
jgi:hypothetical protein